MIFKVIWKNLYLSSSRHGLFSSFAAKLSVALNVVIMWLHVKLLQYFPLHS